MALPIGSSTSVPDAACRSRLKIASGRDPEEEQRDDGQQIQV